MADLHWALWSIDLFRCESATLRTHWILVAMDQYTRRIIGFGVQAGTVDGVALCGMFNQAIRGYRVTPEYLSPDHDPLYRLGQLKTKKIVPAPTYSRIAGMVIAKQKWRRYPHPWVSYIIDTIGARLPEEISS